MEHILDALQDIRMKQTPAVLTTIVHVQGSAYRREGAKMLFLPSGQEKGTLSAGCLESDLAFRAADAATNGTALLHTYDMASEDDFTWGRGSGCNGIITVLIEPLTDASWQHASLWGEVVDSYLKGHTLTVLRQLTGKPTDEPVPVDASKYLLLRSDGQWSGSLGDAKKDAEWKAKVQTFHAGDARNQSIWDEDGNLYMLERVFPKDRLFVCGAGPDSESVVGTMAKLGFEVTVVDPRPVRLQASIFPDAHQLVESHPEQAADKVFIPEGSYAIVMTHSFQSDRLWLQFLNQHKLRYVGVLGPRARTLRLLGTDAIPPHIYSPIGLDLGAEGPDEIAVSIAAEIVKIRRGK